MVMIRAMRTSDYAACDRLWEQTPGMNFRPGIDGAAEIARVVRQNPGLCVVAVVNDKVVGTLIGASEGRRATLYHLAVAADYRHQGLATQMLAPVTAHLRARGLRKVRLVVVNENLAGVAFWTHLASANGVTSRIWIKRWGLMTTQT